MFECPPGVFEGGAGTTILLGMEDITERRVLEREKDELLRQKDVLLEELQHRIANSLQIIAGIILLKAERVDSEETRVHLQDAHKRVMSVAAVQQQIHDSAAGLSRWCLISQGCATLSEPLDDRRRSASQVKGSGDGGTATSREAESLGLITTEFVMNALKHAFPPRESMVGSVTYDVDGTNWKLSVVDNGVGRPDGVFAQSISGLGTGIVKALAQQSVPRLRRWPALRARLCRSLTPLLDQGKPGRVMRAAFPVTNGPECDLETKCIG